MTVQAKNRFYDARVLAGFILDKYPAIRKSADYEALSDRFFDYVSACNVQECRAWLNHYMAEAIEMDTEACKLIGRTNGNTVEQMRYEAGLQFIVAYDLQPR